MKRTGFRRLSYEELLQKKREAEQRAAERRKLKAERPKPPKDPKPAKRPPLKKDRVKTLKRKLWAIFSQYIRRRWADKNGMVLTCDGKFMRWQDTHCGHLLTNTERSQSLGGNELWYYENNFAPQSPNGNYYDADDSAKKYMLFAVGRYGEEEIKKMFHMKQTPRKFTEEELTAKYEHYKQLFDKMNV